MTDLRIFVNVTQFPPHTAHPTCGEAPSSTSRPDSCRIGIALTLEGARAPTPRVLNFDRQGDRFVLSPQNTAENLTWVSSNQNIGGVLTTLRVAGALMQGGRANVNADSLNYMLWLARFITTGVFHHDNDRSPSQGMDINDMLIETFSGGRSSGMANFIGRLDLLRTVPWLPEEARARVTALTNILDMVPHYRAISAHFFNEDRLRANALNDAQITQIARIYHFIRRLTISLHQGRPLRFNQTALLAFRAYSEFYRAEIAAGTQPEFCAVLEAALRERGGDTRPGATFIGECRQALGWAQVPPEQSLRESARQSLTNSAGMQSLQQAITAESRLANMRVEWLSQRGPYSQVLSALLNRIALRTNGEGPSRLSFDIANFAADLRQMTILTSRGEYDLSALAFLRRLFGTEGSAPGFRVFADGVVGEVPWNLSAQDLHQIRELQINLQGRRRTSADFSQVGMPVLLGSICAAGVSGVVLSQALPPLRSNPSAQLGVGLTSAGIAGGGCLGLAGHYFWPAVAPRAVHNPYAWDFGTSVAGSALGIGTYLLIHFLTQGGGTIVGGQRYPVDSYGP